MHVIHFLELEVGEAKQHVFPPVREVDKQTLQRILCNMWQFIIHMNGEPVKGIKDNKIIYYMNSSRCIKKHIWSLLLLLFEKWATLL